MRKFKELRCVSLGRPSPCKYGNLYLIASAKPSVLFGTNKVGVLGTMQSSSSLNGPGAGWP